MTDWVAVARRNARSVQTTIGWIYWDPGAVRRYADLGIPDPRELLLRRVDLTAGPNYQPASRLRERPTPSGT